MSQKSPAGRVPGGAFSCGSSARATNSAARRWGGGLPLMIWPIGGKLHHAPVGGEVFLQRVTVGLVLLAADRGARGVGVAVDGAGDPDDLRCVAGIGVTAGLNIGVSFWLAFRTALRSRGVAVPERSAIRAAIMRRALRRPLSFLWPPATRRVSVA